jgi:hypothetical protein
MNKNNLARVVVAASFVTFVGTVAFAQQAGGGSQPQTRGATTPAEVTPSYPLNSTAGPRTGTATTTGTAATQGGGQSQGNNATSSEKK